MTTPKGGVQPARMARGADSAACRLRCEGRDEGASSDHLPAVPENTEISEKAAAIKSQKTQKEQKNNRKKKAKKS